MAIAATIYLGWLGPAGSRDRPAVCVARGIRCRAPVRRARRRVVFPGAPFFKEFALRLPRSAVVVRDALVERGILAGAPLPSAGEDVLVVAVTEKRDHGEIDRYADALREVLA